VGSDGTMPRGGSALEQDSLVPWPSREEMGRLMAWPQRFLAQAMRDMPCLELAEDGDDLVVRVEVPGANPEDLDIDVTAHTLTVRGEIRQEEHSQGAVYHSERHYGRFQRSVSLPVTVDPDRASAHFHQGLLEVRLPRQEGARRKLRVQGGGTAGRH